MKTYRVMRKMQWLPLRKRQKSLKPIGNMRPEIT